jgi:hypothetical protein
MSVDDRLRAGFEANALDFLPEGEARLTQVRSRLRRRRTLQASAAAVAAAAAVAVVAAVGSDTPSTQRPDQIEQPTPTTGATTTEAVAAPGIPDSKWTRVLTRAQAESAGISEANIVEQMGADDRMPLTFQFQAGSYSIFVTNDEGIDELGDPGSVEYDAPGSLTITSESPGCPGCQEHLTWEIRGDRLILELAPDERMPRLDKFIVLGEWRRAD